MSKKQIFKILGVLTLFVFVWQLSACRKDQFLNSPGIELEFELDTLHFDTVFTNMGTATRKFKVYNPYNKAVRISNIRLGGGSASDFHLNIDGQNSSNVSDIDIPAKDSIYVFANVRIDPNFGDALRIDSILFETNGTVQSVILEAYGWNAVYIGQRGFLTRFTNTNLTLSPDTPYVFFGVVAFDSNSVLTIPAGTDVFMFGGPSTRPGDRALIYIGDNSSIKVNVGGDLNNPVEFKTHRLEEDYQQIPFQHSGIYLSKNSLNNQIHGCIIRNAVDGIIVDSLANNHPTVKLELKNSMILNTDRSSILSRQGSINATNSILSNSSQFGLIAIRGGIYDFKHCTMVNYGTNPFVGHSEPTINLRDFEELYDQNGNVIGVNLFDVYADFKNCVIYGTKNEEVKLSKYSSSTAVWDYGFENCLMKLDTFRTGLTNCILNQDPLFEDKDNYIYAADSVISPMVNRGINLGIFNDIKARPRDAMPDIGAFEF
jgi:hypothetical protein